MSDLRLATPNDFPAFPFKPYDIQLELMRHVYSCIENGNIAITESPTGTVGLSLVSYHPLMADSDPGGDRERRSVSYARLSRG